MKNLTEEERKKRFGHPGLLKGIPRSQETKDKISAAAKGRDMSKAIAASIQKRRENNTPIIVSKNGKFVGEFTLASDIIKQLFPTKNKKSCISCISRALHTGIRAFGYNFNYKTQDHAD